MRSPRCIAVCIGGSIYDRDGSHRGESISRTEAWASTSQRTFLRSTPSCPSTFGPRISETALDSRTPSIT